MDLISTNQDDLIEALSNDTPVHESNGDHPHPPFARNLSPITPRGQRSQSNLAYDKTQQLSSMKGRRMKHLSSSPDKGYARYNDVTQRSLPRKQLQLHEMAIQV